MYTRTASTKLPLSERDFRGLLLHEIVYVRPIQGGVYAVFAADGTHMMSGAHVDCLIQACYDNNVLPLRVH